MTAPSFRWSDAAVRASLSRLSADGKAMEQASETSCADTGSVSLGPPFTVTYSGVSTDSRTVERGELFVALVGENFDGHAFVTSAIERGAAGVLISRPVDVAPTVPTYRVPDTLVALGALAAHRRAHLTAPVAAITGSSGKTTTKELTAAALTGGPRAHVSPGNHNNRIGLPLTLLATPDDAGAVVVEMGTNEPGEIATLADIASPNVVALTTVAEAHLERLGSLEGVLEEKLDLIRALPADSPPPILGDTPPMLAERARSLRPDARVAGLTPAADSDLRAHSVAPHPDGGTSFTWRGVRVRLSLVGRHSVTDALIALALAEDLGADPLTAAADLWRAKPSGMRCEMRQVGGLELIVDCYNSNPQSLTAALDLLEERAHARAPRNSAAVLGSMLELGERSQALHVDGLRNALSRPIDVVAATGEFAKAAEELAADPTRVISAENWCTAYAELRGRMTGDETVLLKGSRGVAMEGIIPLLHRDFAPRAIPAPR